MGNNQENKTYLPSDWDEAWDELEAQLYALGLIED